MSSGLARADQRRRASPLRRVRLSRGIFPCGGCSSVPCLRPRRIVHETDSRVGLPLIGLGLLLTYSGVSALSASGAVPLGDLAGKYGGEDTPPDQGCFKTCDCATTTCTVNTGSGLCEKCGAGNGATTQYSCCASSTVNGQKCTELPNDRKNCGVKIQGNAIGNGEDPCIYGNPLQAQCLTASTTPCASFPGVSNDSDKCSGP